MNLFFSLLKLYTLIIFGIFIFNPSWESRAGDCHLKGDDIVSLSGPLTHLLSSLNLLRDPKILAISNFHGIGADRFSGEIISGGIFMAPQVLKKYQKAVIFYDESRDLKKMFSSFKGNKFVEVKSKNKDPFKVVEDLLEFIRPNLIDCNPKIKELKNFTSSVEKNWKNSKLPIFSMFFFLGKILKGQKLPELVMKDSFVIYLEKLGKILTYPNKLNYIPWSSKVLTKWEKSKNLIKLGLNDQIDKHTFDLKKEQFNLCDSADPYPFCISLEKDEKDAPVINLVQKSLFIPGIPQIYLLQRLQKFLQKYVTQLNKSYSP